MPSAEPPGARQRDTIAAIATPPGRGALGIVRVSGPQAPEIARRLLGRIPEPRFATYGPARDVAGQVLDDGLAL
jgi:tRNA modification GTPase